MQYGLIVADQTPPVDRSHTSLQVPACCTDPAQLGDLPGHFIH